LGVEPTPLVEEAESVELLDPLVLDVDEDEEFDEA
jgi:hypothetical protein